MADARPEDAPRRRDSLKVATASRALPLVAGYGLNLLATPIVASSLGLAQFGLWALTGSFAMYGSLLDLGVARSVTRFTALHLARGDDEAADRVVWTAGALVAFMAAPLVLLGLSIAGPFASLVGFPDAGVVRVVIGASLFILVTGQLCTVLTGAAFGREVQALPNAVITVCGLTGTCLSTTAAVLTGDVVAYAWSAAAWNGVTLIAITVTVHTRIARLRATRPRWQMLLQLASFGLKGQSVLLAELVVFQASKVVLGVASGTSAAGAYELGSRLALGFRTLGGLFTGALTAPLTRAFSERGTPGAMGEANRLTRTVVTLSIVPPLMGAAMASAFLSLWLGEHAVLTLATMLALCIGFTANMLTSVQQVVAEAIGRPGLSARSAAFTAVLSLALGTSLLLTVGPVGLVAGTGAAIVMGSAYNIALVQPAVGSTQRHYYSLIAGPSVLGVSAGLAAYLAIAWLDTDGRGAAALAVALGSTVFLLLYGVTALVRGYVPRHWLPRPRR